MGKSVNPEVRFHNGYQINANGCWIWQHRLTLSGYGTILVYKKEKLAHRYSYELYKGEIAKSYDIDHLCRNRACVNPDHLEAVTRQENIIRGKTGIHAGQYNKAKTHCPRGHEYTPNNTQITQRQGRFGISIMRSCRKCKIINQRIRRQKHSC